MFYPNTPIQKGKRVCSCTTTVYVNLSMNSFILLTGNFVPESGCKGRTFFNNTQAFLRKMFKRNARFHISLHKTNKRGEYTLIYIGNILGISTPSFYKRPDSHDTRPGPKTTTIGRSKTPKAAPTSPYLTSHRRHHAHQEHVFRTPTAKP